MATLYSLITGFESGLSSPSANGGGLAYAIGGTPTIVGSPVRSGSYSLLLNPSASDEFLQWDIPGTDTYIYIASFYVRFPTLPTTMASIWAAYPSWGDSMTMGYDGSTGQWHCQCGSGSVVHATFGAVAGTWHKVDIKVNVTTVDWTIDYKIDGTDGAQGTWNGGGASYISTCGLGQSYAETYTCNIDDYIDSIVGGDYPLNAHKVLGLRPSSDGSHNNGTNILEDAFGNDIDGVSYFANGQINKNPWTTGTGVRIQQNLVGASNYVEANFEDTTETNILGARAYLQYGSAAAQGNNAACGIIDEDSTFQELWGNPTTKQDYSDTPFYKSKLLPPPSGGWDQGAVNALKVRCGYAGDATPDPWWLNVIVEVAIQEAASGAMIGSSTGTSTVSGKLTGIGSLIGSISGSSTASGNLNGITPIIGNSEGIATVSGSLNGIGSLIGTSDGLSTVSGSLNGIGSLIGTSDGLATVLGILLGTGILSGSAEGVSTVTGNCTPAGSIGELIGSSEGIASVSGSINGLGNLIGNTEGISTVTGLLNGLGNLVGSAEGVATVTGNCTPAESIGELVGSSEGNSTVTGVLSGNGVLSGLSEGIGTVFATLIGQGLLSGSTEGFSTSSGLLIGSGLLFGESSGLATVSGVLLGTGILSGESFGVSTVEGILRALSDSLSGYSFGTSIVTGNLGGIGNLAGISNGLATVSGILSAIIPISGSISCISNVTGVLSGLGSLSGITEGLSFASGNIYGLIFISGSIFGESYSNGVLTGIANLVGLSQGISSISGNIFGLGKLSGLSQGFSTVIAILIGYFPISGISIGLSNVFGNLTMANYTPTDPSRIYIVESEDRKIIVLDENRINIVGVSDD